MINLPTEEAVLELDCHRCYEGNAKPRLLWFSDSKRVAYCTQHPHGGYTEVYFRRGPFFEEVQLPSIPNLKFPREAPPDEQTITSISESIRWLKSGALVLRQDRKSSLLTTRPRKRIDCSGGDIATKLKATLLLLCGGKGFMASFSVAGKL